MSLKQSLLVYIGLLFLLLSDGSRAAQDVNLNGDKTLDLDGPSVTEDASFVLDSDVPDIDGELLDDDAIEESLVENVSPSTEDAFQKTAPKGAEESMTDVPIVESLVDDLEIPSDDANEAVHLDETIHYDKPIQAEGGFSTIGGESKNLSLPVLSKEEELQALKTQLEELQRKNEALEEDLDYYHKHESFVYKLIGGQMIEFVCISLGLLFIMKVTDILLMVTDILEEVVIPIVRTGPVYNMQSKKEVSIMF